MHPLIILQLLFLLMVANGTPVIAKKLLGSRCSYPLDGGVGFIDGRPLFGTSKTIRGILLAIVTTVAAAPATLRKFLRFKSSTVVLTAERYPPSVTIQPTCPEGHGWLQVKVD